MNRAPGSAPNAYNATRKYRCVKHYNKPVKAETKLQDELPFE